MAEKANSIRVLSIEEAKSRAEIQKAMLKANNINNVYLCNYKMELADFVRSSRTTEMYDTIIAMSVLHYFSPKELPEIIYCISRLAQNFIIELPSEEEKEVQGFKGITYNNFYRLLCFYYDSVRELLELTAPKGKGKRKILLCQKYQIRRERLQVCYNGHFSKKHIAEYQDAGWKIDGKKIGALAFNLQNILDLNPIYPSREKLIDLAVKNYYQLITARKGKVSDIGFHNILCIAGGLIVIDFEEGLDKKQIYGLSIYEYTRKVLGLSYDDLKRELLNRKIVWQ